jgi:hypothetical protein
MNQKYPAPTHHAARVANWDAEQPVSYALEPILDTPRDQGFFATLGESF